MSKLDNIAIDKKAFLIGIAGAAGAGKDTVAAMLKNELEEKGYPVMHTSFAAPIKLMLEVGLHWVKDSGNTKQLEELYGTDFRTLAQTLGTEWGRKLIHPDLWVLRAAQFINKYLAQNSWPAANAKPIVFIFSDVRFNNEAFLIRKHGLILHKQPGKVSMLTEEQQAHASERGVSVNYLCDLEVPFYSHIEAMQLCIPELVAMYIEPKIATHVRTPTKPLYGPEPTLTEQQPMKENKFHTGAENPVDYNDMVTSLAKPGIDILESLTPEKCEAWHHASCIPSEAGELFDAVKKWIIYGKDSVDMDNVVEELGDIEFYLEGLRQAMNVTRSQTLNANWKKLSKRYEAGYSDTAALNRADKNKEGAE